MATIVGTLQVDLVTNTASFTFDDAVLKGKKGAKDIEDAVNKIDISEARGTLALLGDDLGVRLPRHVQTFVAELPGVGQALEAAFGAAAVLALGVAIVEGVSKLIEYENKQEELRIKAEEIGNAWAESSQKIQQEIDTQEAKIVAFNQGPVAGIAFAFEHAASEAIKHIKDIETELTQAAGMITASGNVFSNWLDGSDEASADLKKFSADLTQTMLAAESGSDHFASLNAGIEAATKKSGELQKKIKDTQDLISGDNDVTTNAVLQTTLEGYKKESAAIDDVLRKLLQLSNLQSTTDKANKDHTSQANFSQTKQTAGENLQKRLAEIEQEKEASIDADTAMGDSLDVAKAKEDARYSNAELQAHLEYFHTLEQAGGDAMQKQQLAADKQIYLDKQQAQADQQLAQTRSQNTVLTNELDSILFNQAKEQQNQESDAAKQAISDIEKKNKALLEQTNLMEALGDKRVADINKQIKALNDLINSGRLNESTTVAAYAAIHQLELQRQKDLNDDMTKSSKLGQVMHGTLNQMIQDGQQWQQKVGQLFQKTVGQMNTDLAQFVVEGKADWKGLATSALESIIEIFLQYEESQAAGAIMDALGLTEKKAKNAAEAESSTNAAAANTLADVPFPANIPAAASIESLGQGYTAAALTASQGALLPNAEALVHTHPEEMILPRPISNFIVNAVGNATGSGVTHNHAVFAPNITAMDATGVDAVLTKHMDVFTQKMQREARRRNRARF